MRFSTISAIHLLIAGIALGAPLDQTLKNCMLSFSLLYTHGITLLIRHRRP